MSSNMGRAWAGAAMAMVAVAPAALAHPGPHATMSFTELATHLATGWHLALLLGAIALATVVVIVASRSHQARAARSARNRRSGL